MIRTLFEMFFKNYIDEQIDKRFTENMIERYWAQRQNETSRRLQQAREQHNINNYAPEGSTEVQAETKILSSSELRWDDAKSRVQTKTTASSLKDKLKGINK
jgi:hypothetical protein